MPAASGGAHNRQEDFSTNQQPGRATPRRNRKTAPARSAAAPATETLPPSLGARRGGWLRCRSSRPRGGRGEAAARPLRRARSLAAAALTVVLCLIVGSHEVAVSRHRGGPGSDAAHRQHLLIGGACLPDGGGPAGEAGESSAAVPPDGLIPSENNPGSRGRWWSSTVQFLRAPVRSGEGHAPLGSETPGPARPGRGSGWAA